MMKAEFEVLIGESIADAEYKVIETVYMWHPAIKDTTGKEQMKVLYNDFGIGVIKGMLPIAWKMEKLDVERRKLETQMKAIKYREKMLSAGDTKLEDAIEKMDALYVNADTITEFEQMLNDLEIEEDMMKVIRTVAGYGY